MLEAYVCYWGAGADNHIDSLADMTFETSYSSYGHSGETRHCSLWCPAGDAIRPFECSRLSFQRPHPQTRMRSALVTSGTRITPARPDVWSENTFACDGWTQHQPTSLRHLSTPSWIRCRLRVFRNAGTRALFKQRKARRMSREKLIACLRQAHPKAL